MPTLKAVLNTNQSTIFACSDRARDPPVDGPAFQVAAHDPIDIEHGQSRSHFLAFRSVRIFFDPR